MSAPHKAVGQPVAGAAGAAVQAGIGAVLKAPLPPVLCISGAGSGSWDQRRQVIIVDRHALDTWPLDALTGLGAHEAAHAKRGHAWSASPVQVGLIVGGCLTSAGLIAGLILDSAPFRRHAAPPPVSPWAIAALAFMSWALFASRSIDVAAKRRSPTTMLPGQSVPLPCWPCSTP